ncbi:MAG: hypothetical protein Q8P05_06260 [Candidatus Diapherotrites archaeon]|nr:hypothetical protein [Candidatus Diapherotrites archaeon]
MSDIEHENEAYEELKDFLENRFNNFHYTIIVGLGRIENDKEIYAMGFTLSNTDAHTPFGIIKGIIANIIAEYQQLIDQYEPNPAPSLFKTKGEKPNA